MVVPLLTIENIKKRWKKKKKEKEKYIQSIKNIM